MHHSTIINICDEKEPFNYTQFVAFTPEFKCHGNQSLLVIVVINSFQQIQENMFLYGFKTKYINRNLSKPYIILTQDMSDTKTFLINV